MKKKIILIIDFIYGCKFQVGEEKKGIYQKLDNAFEDCDVITITVGSSTQLLAAEMYAIEHNCSFKVKLHNGEFVEGEDLCKAHYEANHEYISLSNEYELLKDKSE